MDIQNDVQIERKRLEKMIKEWEEQEKAGDEEDE